jgi:hypothetical protein
MRLHARASGGRGSRLCRLARRIRFDTLTRTRAAGERSGAIYRPVQHPPSAAMRPKTHRGDSASPAAKEGDLAQRFHVELH